MFKRKHICCGKHFKTGDEIDSNIIVNNSSNNTNPNNNPNSINSNNSIFGSIINKDISHKIDKANIHKANTNKANTNIINKANTHKADTHNSTSNVINNISNNKSLGYNNFKAYIGKTVTVYVNGGGISGSGFTGVLLGSDEVVVRLLTQPASAPACALGGACDTYIKAPILCAVCPNAQQFNLGIVVEIPIWNIVAFVHNAIEIFF